MNEREIFMDALDLENPAERSAFLDEKCATDLALRQRIETLLASHEGAGSFLGIPVADRLANHAGLPLSTDETQGMSTDERVAESLDFLTPSQQPGSLGHLGHYEVLEVIGRGGFGIVVRAFDEKLHRVVAIKIMAPQLAATSAPRKRFLREARAAAAIRHDNVINIFSVEEHPIPYLVMEYIDGPTLQQKLDASGPLDLPDIVRFGQQIAGGLAAAHGMRLIHRDIKPGNILLENGIEQRVKITDFGLARAADDASMTQTGSIAGTPMYMAPEQACGAMLDHRADLFSLGSVLYVMCSGRPPFRASNSVAVLKRVVEDVPRPIQEIIPETPGWLCDIIARLHAKQPEDRFESAQEVADLLGRCWTEMQQHGQVTSLPSPAEKVLPSKVPHPNAGRLGRDIGGRRWTAAAALLLLLFGGLGLSEATGLSRLTTTIIRIATGEGTLVIESNDPSVKLLIDGEQVTISGAGVDEVRLNPGSYKLAALRDGQPIKVDRELVTISRGGRQVVRVLLEPAATRNPSEGSTDSSWISLFNGHDLTGWQAADGASQWLVKDKVLTSHGPPGYLFSERSDYVDFHLRAEVRVNSQGNSGILVRTLPSIKDQIFNGHRYRLVQRGVSWEQAKVEAEALGGHLATVTSQDEDDWLRQQFGSALQTNNSSFWLGATQATLDAPWKWVTEEPFTYTSWADNEPNCRSMITENQTPYHLNFHRSTSYPTEFGWNDSGAGPNPFWRLQTIGYLVEWDDDMLPAEALESEFNSPGHEAQICADITGQPKTGSLWTTRPWTCVAKVDPSPVPAGTWFKLEIIVRGRRFIVKVNDVQTAEYSSPQYLQDSGHIALQQNSSHTCVEFRKIEIQEFAPTRPEANAFVRLGRPGGKEQSYNTLVDAVKASRPGDTIEIRGNGPFVTPGIDIRHPLTIRAAQSFSPVLQLDEESISRKTSFVTTYVSLVLEGLSLERLGTGTGAQDRSIPYANLVVGRHADWIYATNCRFVNSNGPCFQFVGNSNSLLPECKGLQVLNSECLSFKAADLQGIPGVKYDVENSVLSGWITLSLPQMAADKCLVRLDRSTLLSGGSLVIIDQLPKSAESLLVNSKVRFNFTSNVVMGNAFGLMLLSSDQLTLAAELEDFGRRSIEWNDSHNVWDQTGLSLYSVTRDWKPIPTSLRPGLENWNSFWNQTDTGSIEGTPLFQGGDLYARAKRANAELTAEDFRLLPDSPGYRAGSDGKDLGPDIDFVGPGEAYERWKQTPGYQQWLTESQQLIQGLKGEAPTSVEKNLDSVTK